MDAEKYSQQIEIVDMTEAQALVIKVIMQEGALRFQEQCIKALEEVDLLDAAAVVQGVEFDI